MFKFLHSHLETTYNSSNELNPRKDFLLTLFNWLRANDKLVNLPKGRNAYDVSSVM